MIVLTQNLLIENFHLERVLPNLLYPLNCVYVLIGDEHVYLRSSDYHLTMYAVEVTSRYDFVRWGEETKYTVWMTAEEFRRNGRRDHVIYVDRIEALLAKEK